MNVSKILGAALIVLSSCYIGFSSAAGINIELRDLRRLISALDYMSCELQYNLTPLPTLCKETAKECEGKFKHLFILLAEAVLMNQHTVISITDEPELSLHIAWQRNLLSSIRKLNSNAQIIVATHSPEIAGGFPSSVIDMESIVK